MGGNTIGLREPEYPGAVRNGLTTRRLNGEEVSITPIHLDTTHHGLLDRLRVVGERFGEGEQASSISTEVCN